MLRRRLTLAAACTAPLLALAAIPASAAGAEVDTAVLTYSPASGWDCSFTSPDEGTGPCTVSALSLGVSCLGVAPPVRNGSIALVEPSGEAVHLALSVTGSNSGGVFAGTGTDATTPVTAAGTVALSCKGDMATGGRVTLTWAPVSVSPTS